MSIRIWPLALLLAALLTGCEEEGPNIDVESSIPVRVEPVTRGSIEEYISATGTALALRETALKTLQVGHYQLQTNPRTNAPFAMGDPVREGEVLVRLENPEFENQVSIDARKLHYTVSQREHEKQKVLFQKGGITLRELTDAERILIDARYAYENARLQLAKLEVKIPFDGILVDLPHYTPGQRLEPNAPLGQVMDYAQLYAEIALPGKELGRIHPEQRAQVTHYGGQADTLVGRIAQVSPVLDRESRMFKAVLGIANDSLLLRPGMFVRVDIVVAAKDSALVIPKDAIIDRGEARTVFVVEKGIALERQLETGLSNPLQIEVLSGLDEDERLVVEGFETLRHHSKVKIDK